MKATGIVRRIDDLGRIVIPKEIRKTLKLDVGDPLEIYVENDELIFKKYSPIKGITDLSHTVAKVLSTVSEKSVLIFDTESVISAEGNAKSFLNEKMSKDAQRVLESKRSYAISKSENINMIRLTDGDESKFKSQILVPILDDEKTPLGLLCVLDTENNKATGEDIKLAKLSAEFLSQNAE